MSQVTIEFDVAVPMRDGVVLRADVYRPAGQGPWPVIVARTPYGKSDPFVTMLLDPLLAVRHGLIAVIQDVRGRSASGGDVFVPGAAEALDGADTIEWAATISDSTGRVGMWGLSYLGNAQWLAAAQRPPALDAIAPSMTFRTGDGLSERGGARELGLNRSWSVFAGFDALSRRSASPEALGSALTELVAAADGLASTTNDELPTGTSAQDDPLSVRLDLPTLDALHMDVSSHQARVDVPVLNIGGWYDVFLQGTLDNFVHGGPRDRVVIGPWNHMSLSPQQGELSFGSAGSAAAIDLGASLGSMTFDWLRDRLTGKPDDDGDRVMIYTMGAGRWRTELTWPLPHAVDTRWYLGADGRLHDDIAAVDGESSSFTADPADPVRTLGGNTLLEHPLAGTFDQSGIEARDDVLVFTSAVLHEPVEVTGRVTATIEVSTDAPTSDWVVRLCDVHPDGTSFNVCDGIARVVAAAGDVSVVEVDLWSTSMLFDQGHRIRIDVTSSSFPRWDRNLHTPDGAVTGQMRAARQTIHLNGRAYVTLPVVRPTRAGD